MFVCRSSLLINGRKVPRHGLRLHLTDIESHCLVFVYRFGLLRVDGRLFYLSNLLMTVGDDLRVRIDVILICVKVFWGSTTLNVIYNIFSIVLRH